MTTLSLLRAFGIRLLYAPLGKSKSCNTLLWHGLTKWNT
jgi:hypothetical protein